MNSRAKKTIIISITAIILFIGSIYAIKKVYWHIKPYIESRYILPRKRLRIAREEKGRYLKNLFQQAGFNYPPEEIFLRVFKNMTLDEMKPFIELWAKEKDEKIFKLIKTFPVCRVSGTIGPKRMEGDRQIPEGFYEISAFNPRARRFLSLKINYPNESDKILGNKEHIGGNIFIHGGCSSVGCLSISNDLIKELYLIALDTKSKDNIKIKVHIFPLRMDERNMKYLDGKADGNRRLLSFWHNLRRGYDLFEKNHIPPDVTVDHNGVYHFN